MGGDSGSCLEMRCSADKAWYDGTLTFESDAKDMIIVHFNDFGEEEDEMMFSSFLLNPKKLKSRVRVRSEQLQDFQCKLVIENQLICGCLDDGENRRYYDAQVVSIDKKQHSYHDDSEDCKCNFKLLWLDGPKEGKHTVVGCAEVCFLSNDAPEDDPMVKNLVKSLAGNGEQRRKPTTAPKTLPSSQLPLRKKLSSSKDHPPTSTLLNQRVVQLGQQANAKSVGSKKKRIMQPEESEQPDLSSDNDNLRNLDTRTPPKDRSCEVFEDVRGHSNESDDSERRGSGGESTKKGCIPVEKKRLFKLKDQAAPEVVVRDQAAAVRQEDDIPRPVQNRIISSTKNLATPDVAAHCEKAAGVRKDCDVVFRPSKWRAKSNTSEKKKIPDDAAARDEAARDEAAAVTEDDIPHSRFKERDTSNTKNLATDVDAVRDEAIPLTCEERVKLKSLEKSKSVEASPQQKSSKSVETSPQKKSVITSEEKKPEVIPQTRKPAAHKANLQNVGKQPVGKKMENNLKQVQLDSRLSSKLDEATRPGTSSRPNNVAEAEPKEHLQEPTTEQKNQKGGEPKKRSLSNSDKQSLPSKKQPVQRCSKEQRQNSQQEEKIIDTRNVEKQISNPAPNKKQRLEEPLAIIPDTDDMINSRKSTKENVETLDEPQQARGNKERKRKEPLQPHHPQQQPPQSGGDEAHSQKSKSAENDKHQAPLIIKNTKRPSTQPHHQTERGDSAGGHTSDNNNDEDDVPLAATTLANTKRLVQKSIAETCHDIDMRYGSNRQPSREECSVEKKTSEAIIVFEAVTPGSSLDEELTASPPSPPRVSKQIQENVRVTDFRAPRTQTEINASGKKRRRDLIVIDDEEDDDVQAPPKNLKNLDNLNNVNNLNNLNNLKSVNNLNNLKSDKNLKSVKNVKNLEKKGKELQRGSVESSANSQDDCGDPKSTSTSALDVNNLNNLNNLKSDKNLKNVNNLKNLEKKAKELQRGSVESSANSQDECGDPKTTSTSALDVNNLNTLNNLKNVNNLKSDKNLKSVKNVKNLEKKAKELQHASLESSENSQDDFNDPKTTSTSASDEEIVVQKKRKDDDDVKATTRLLMLSNMEPDVSALDAMLVLQEQTEGVCAVHVLPMAEFQSCTVGYALYRDSGSARKAFVHLASTDRFVVSPSGRPWIVSQSTNTYGPHFFGFAARTAIKSDNPGVCGIISDQPPIQELIVVTKDNGNNKAYSHALQRSKLYAEQQNWRKELHERIVLGEQKVRL